MRIAIQGGPASFHDMVARQYFQNEHVEIVECRTFRQQCTQLLDGRVDYIVMAIENSLAGGILPNYSLLQHFPFRITGEHYLHIKQNFMALPGQTLADIQVVRSHPMALHQCSEFLELTKHLRSEESYDTADSAREIRALKLTGVAAIASELAAKLYQLEILLESVENIKDNYTRFLILVNHQEKSPARPNKASLCFCVKHEVGALAGVLDIFRDNNVNLCLIQSIPIPGCLDEYVFHLDLEWQSRADYGRAIALVRRSTRKFTVLGEYCSGDKPYENTNGEKA